MVIHNADAGDGSQPPALVRRVLDDAGYEPRYVSTHADWEAALREQVDLVVLVGGDGTVAQAIRLLGGRQVPVALLPTGTANNLAKTMGIAGDARAIVRSWRDRAIAPLDVWVAQSPAGREPFVEAVGGGLIATTIARGWELEAPSFILGSELDRALHVLRDVAQTEPARRWSVTVDGADHSGDYLGVEIMNGPSVGPNIPLAAGAEPGDGSLDVVLLREADRVALVERFRTLPSALAATHAGPSVVRGRAVTIVAPGDVELHLDGDVWPQPRPHRAPIEIDHAGVVDVLVEGPASRDSPHRR